MKVSVDVPVVTPPKVVTLIMTEEEARFLELLTGCIGNENGHKGRIRDMVDTWGRQLRLAGIVHTPDDSSKYIHHGMQLKEYV